MFCYKLTAINIHSSDPGSSSWNRRKEANAVLYQSCSSRLIWGDAYPRVRNDDDLPIDSAADVGTSCLVSSCLCHQHILLIRRVSYPRWKTLSRTSWCPAFGSIFLLNNISYLRLHLLLHHSNPNLPNFISQATEEALNSNFRIAKAGYLDSNFSPLMQAISEDPRDKSNRAAAKEKSHDLLIC